jgi:hypothetical protein
MYKILSRKRQNKNKHTSMAFFTFNPDLAAMRFDGEFTKR